MATRFDPSGDWSNVRPFNRNATGAILGGLLARSVRNEISRTELPTPVARHHPWKLSKVPDVIPVPFDLWTKYWRTNAALAFGTTETIFTTSALR